MSSNRHGGRVRDGARGVGERVWAWACGGVIGVTLMSAIALVGCAGFSRGGDPVEVDAGDASDAVVPGDAGEVTYAADVHALLIGGCQRCHATDGEASDTQFLLTGDATVDFATAVMFVDTSAPSGSRMLAKMSGHGHQGGTVYAMGTPEYATVLQWIQEGARP